MRTSSVARLALSLVLAVLLGAACTPKNGEASGPEGNSAPTRTPETTQASPDGPLATSAGLPQDFRACTRDDECVVAPSLAGLDHLPQPGDTCTGACTIGVRREHLAAWNAAVQELAASVPCDKEFEECPPLTAYTASCSLGTCRVKYTP